MGDAIVGDVALALERLVALVPEGTRDAPEARPEPGDPPAADPPDRLSGSEAMAALADAFARRTRSSSSSLRRARWPLRNRLRISTPGSYYFCASGGLGFGIAAAVGVQLAQPSRPVVCVLGEGSAQYGITALWSALAYKAPVTFLILRNDEYMILKWFAMLEQVSGAPGPGPAGPRRRRGRPRLRPARPGRDRPRGAHRGPARRRSPPTTGRASSRSRSPPGCGWSDAPVALTAADPGTIVPEPPGPAPDRAPDWVAAGTPEPLRSRLVAALGADRVLTRALDLVRYASDASPYRLIPQAVAVPRDVDDVVALLRCATELRGAADLPRRRHQPQRPEPDRRDPRRRPPALAPGPRRGRRARELRAQPGVVLGHANRLLARHGRRLGPDPASTNIACVGGVIANNSGGMRCGVVADSYRTVSAMTLVLANGAVIDTAAPDAEERFAAAAPELAAGLERDSRPDPRRRRPGAAHRAQVRDQEHHGLPAVRLPGRRHAAGDLPPARRRLRGDAGLRGRGGVRHRAARAPHHARPGRLRGPRCRGRRRSASSSTPGRPPPS